MTKISVFYVQNQFLLFPIFLLFCSSFLFSCTPPKAAGASHDSARANVHSSGLPVFKTPPKFHEKTAREGRKKENCGGKEKGEILGPPPFGPHLTPPPGGATLRGPTLWGPYFLCSGPHPSAPPPFGTPPFGPHPSGLMFLGLGTRPLKLKLGVGHTWCWPNLVWPKLVLATDGMAKLRKNSLAKVFLAKDGNAHGVASKSGTWFG